MTIPATLFVIFNRPDTTAQVFEAIRAARPDRLYVAADGPRSNRVGEAELCAEARRIATSVDWPCEVKTLFRESNLGCRMAVSSAIDWFFVNESEGIILEDDCLPSSSFFQFCGELLEKYRNDDRVMAVCGSAFIDMKLRDKASYYFSYYPDMWGWATWKRAWAFCDQELVRWPDFEKSRTFESMWASTPWRREYWRARFNMAAAGQIDTWDYQWIYTAFERGGLACYPIKNLISNLGFRSDATHTIVQTTDDFSDERADRPHQILQFPLVHPGHVNRSEFWDRKIDAFRLRLVAPPSLGTRFYRKIRKTLKYLLTPVLRNNTNARI